MTQIATPDRWKNPFARFGFVTANVLTGDGIEPGDRELFFGPTTPGDVFVDAPAHWSMAKLLTHLQLFGSVKEAERKGHNARTPISEGFTDLLNIGQHKNRVTILKATREVSS
jgi:hypothetical protein